VQSEVTPETDRQLPNPLEYEYVVPYLLKAGLVTEEQVVRSRAELSVQVRKNISYIARFGDESFLLKRPKVADDPGVHRELAFYVKVLASHKSFRTFAPDLLRYDPNGPLIVIRHYSEHVDLRRRFTRSRHTPTGLGVELGRILATLHSAAPTDWEKSNLQAPKPWLLSLLEPSLDILITESPGTIEILRRVQASAALANFIESIAEDLRIDGIYHGDLRLDNVLYGPHGQVILVDWELCGVGSTSWDLACLLASVTELWAANAVRRPDGTDTIRVSAKLDLPRFQPILKSFWVEYCRLRGLSPHWLDWSKQVSQLTGLRLVQAALEYSQTSVSPTREAVMLLTLAERFVVRPMESWVHILGLPLSTTSGKISLE
jgi:aminoglycoside phosphotransferase (APT) family kinase protein